MKKSIALIMAAMLTMSALGGCAKEGANAGEKINGALQQLKVEDYVTLADYSNLTVEVAPMQVITDDQVEETYVAIYQENAKVTDRAVVNGDTVSIDFVGTKDGVAFEGGTANDYILEIGSNSFIEGFEAGLVGVMPGETVELNLTFPEDYGNEELNGAAVVFTVTVDAIKANAEDPMTDEGAATMGIPGVENLEQLHQYVVDRMNESVESAYNSSIQNGMMEQLMENSTFNEVPAEFLKPYEAIVESQLVYYASMYGMDVDMYVSLMGVDKAEYLTQLSNAYAQQDILVQAIANKEDLVPTTTEVEEAMQAEMEKYELATKEELLGETTEEEYANFVLYKRVMEFLASKANIVEVEPEVAPEVESEASTSAGESEAASSEAAAE